jgi:GTPase SAR1 family protein
MVIEASVTIVLVGDTKCGKSTFLSFVYLLLSLYSRGNETNWTPRRVTSKDPTAPITMLRDMDQPFIFEVNSKGSKFRLEFHDTASPDNWMLLEPDVLVVCYDISQRLSLINMKRHVRLSPLPDGLHL